MTNSRVGEGVEALGSNHVVHREVDLECIQGIAVELRHVLPEGWTFRRQADSFIVQGKLAEGWEDRLWRVVRFVTYADFMSLQRTQKEENEVRYEMVSASDSGLAFRIELILTRAV